MHVEIVDEAVAAYESTKNIIKYSHLALTGSYLLH